MPGAAGAYASSTGTIYLNQDWLQSASQEQVLAVLTEELGHLLDWLLNSSDTPGDEGELFAALLQREGVISERERWALQPENDQGVVLEEGLALEAEQAAGANLCLHGQRHHGQLGRQHPHLLGS